MNTIIDMTDMRFVYASTNFRLLSSLAHIELIEQATLVCDATYQGSYARFTDLELKLLYKNTFGVESFFSRGGTIQVLMDNALDLPQVDADPYEALVQANSLAQDDDGFYHYQKGTMVPQVLEEAFPYEALRLRPPVLGDKPFVPVQAPQAPTGHASIAASTKVAVAPREPRAPGGARPRIFEVADSMWAAAGSPRDMATVLNLRKQMMNALETEGIKRTTSSTALGEWQKTRLA